MLAKSFKNIPLYNTDDLKDGKIVRRQTFANQKMEKIKISANR